MSQMVIKIPNVRKIFQMTIKYVHILTFSNLRPSKINQNWNFGFENKPSGNPGRNAFVKNSPMV
jgi:hypothetical protein